MTTPMPIYLILEKDVVIAADLVETIEAREPGAEVHVATSCEAAGTLLDGLPPVGTAIVNAPLDEFVGSGLAARVEGAGGVVVALIGREGDAVPAGAGWTVVRRPYSSDDVLTGIDRAQSGIARRKAAE